MAKSPPEVRSPLDIVASIDDQAANVREAAEALTQRIADFETYLSKLAGRVETVHCGDHPDGSPDGQLHLLIRFHREGKSWALSWAQYHPSWEPDEPDWQLLKDAPLKIKIVAVRRFPDLLESMEQSQQQLVKKLTKAVERYDEFAKTLGIGKERQ